MLLPFTTLYNYSEGVASGGLVTAGHPTPGAALCYYCARLVFYCEYVELVPTQPRSRGRSEECARPAHVV